jgi:hypothetical protein
MSVNNNDLKNMYIKLKVVLSGCRHISDAYEISNTFIKKYPQYKNLIISYINGKSYSGVMSIKMIQSTIKDIIILKYADEVSDLVETIYDGKNVTNVQKRTFIRLGKMKNIKPYMKQTYQSRSSSGDISKNCPHCGYTKTTGKEENYVICGYDVNINGLDPKGCGRDWCFTCGKLLCKEWPEHSLFLEGNRYHNKRCCYKHSVENKKDYANDYCQCSNNYVNRDDMITDNDNDYLYMETELSNGSD